MRTEAGRALGTASASKRSRVLGTSGCDGKSSRQEFIVGLGRGGLAGGVAGQQSAVPVVGSSTAGRPT